MNAWTSHDYRFACHALSRATDAGLLLVTAEQRLAFIDGRARALLECPAGAARAACWRHVAPLVQRALASSRPLPGADVRRYTPTAPDAPRVHLDVHDLPTEAATANGRTGGHLLLVHDRAGFDALRDALRGVVRTDGTEHLYRVLAHDARHPITAALMHLSMLKEYDYEQFAARGARALDLVERQLRETNEVIGHLVDALVPDDDPEPLDLRAVALDVLALAQPTVRRTPVTLTTDVVGRCVWRYGHRHQLTQALLGLLAYVLAPNDDAPATNDDEGHRASLRLHLDGDRAVFVVAHGPPGLSAAARDRLLVLSDAEGLPPAPDAEVPLDAEARPDAEAPPNPSDLALAVHAAHRATARHDGTFAVESTPTAGTVFRLALPFDETAPLDRRDARPAEIPSAEIPSAEIPSAEASPEASVEPPTETTADETPRPASGLHLEGEA